MKRLEIFALMLVMAACCYAAPRNVSQAAEIAAECLSLSGKRSVRAKALQSSMTMDSTAGFYVFNADGGGFVLVSGDDRAVPVLAYSDEGSLDINNAPENVRAWLDIYEHQMQLISHSDLEVSEPVTDNVYDTAVEPLLGNIRWDQGNPYNILCPIYSGTEHCAVGCVATAMAQIMLYYRYPQQGYGSVSYTDGLNHNVNANFGNTTYDWDNMLTSYIGEHNGRQDTAAAVLSYHCGAAVEMEYYQSSGATEYYVPYALYYYFGYDDGMTLLDRDVYQAAEWNNIVKTELDAGRPVFYSATTLSKEGHAFVVDGYNKQGLFHLNWGWGGMSNGYFSLSALNPGVQGIGGSPSLDGFNCHQDMVIGIMPSTGHSDYVYGDLRLDALEPKRITYDKASGVTITAQNLVNSDVSEREVTLALGVYDSQGNLMGIYGERSYTIYPIYPQYPRFANLHFANLAEGNYEIRLLYSNYEGDEWHTAAYMYGTPCTLPMQITEEQVLFTEMDKSLDLELIDIRATTPLYGKNLRTTMKGGFEYTVTNHGAEYYDTVRIAMRKVGEQDYTLIGNKVMLNVPTDEVVTVSTNELVSVGVGMYELALAIYQRGVAEPVEYLNNGTVVEVLQPPFRQSYLLEVTEPMSFADNDHVYQDYTNLSITLSNSGSVYCGTVEVYIYSADDTNQYYVLQAFAPRFVCLSGNETVTLVFDDILELDAGQYTAYAYYTNTLGSAISLNPTLNSTVNFTMVDGKHGTALQSTRQDDMVINIEPEGNTMFIATEGKKQAKIYDTLGRLAASVETNENIDVSTLSRGIYIVRVGDMTRKIFIK